MESESRQSSGNASLKMRGPQVTPLSIDIVVAGDDLISPYVVKNLTTESFHIDGGGFYSIWGTTSSLPRLCSLEFGRMVHI